MRIHNLFSLEFCTTVNALWELGLTDLPLCSQTPAGQIRRRTAKGRRRGPSPCSATPKKFPQFFSNIIQKLFCHLQKLFSQHGAAILCSSEVYCSNIEQHITSTFANKRFRTSVLWSIECLPAAWQLTKCIASRSSWCDMSYSSCDCTIKSVHSWFYGPLYSVSL